MRALLGILLPLLMATPPSVGAAGRPAGPEAPPVLNTIVILVEFQDKVFPPGFKVSTMNTLLQQVADYVAEVSADRSQLRWQLHSRIVRLDRPLTYYGADREVPGDDRGGNPRGLLALIVDTIAKVDLEVDFSRFRYVFIAHAAPDQAETARDTLSPAIWSQTLFDIQPPITTRPEGATLEGASIVSYLDPLGVWVHELAHLIGSLPDMYIRSKGGTIHLAGPWSLMDQGAQLGGGGRPAHLDAWSKWVLGWLDLETVVASSPLTAILEAVNGSPRPRALRIPLLNGSFYVIEARVRRGFDSLLPAEGVLIYLVTPGRRVSETLVRVVDTRPDTRTLADAVLDAQRLYEDRANRVFIEVVSREGDRFTLRVGAEVTIRFGLTLPARVYALQPAAVQLVVQPVLSGLIYELYVDGLLYDRGVVSQPSILYHLYFTPWRIGNHNITFLVSDLRNLVVHREAKQIAVDIHPLTPLLLLLPIAAALLPRLRRGGQGEGLEADARSGAKA